MSDSPINNDSLFSDNTSETGLVNVSIENELQTAYLEYAMSVIVSRALPDVRDGLKPVQRRILYSMGDTNLAHNKPHKKSAKVVGDVISKYHPHGDTSIYDALVRLAQDFSLGTPLVDGQGNFGSIDNDPPAAMRYTEVRLNKITHTLLEDIDKGTVEYRDNYDGSEQEPTVLPAAFPQILANGSEGIAVGMATNMPPHNLGEVLDACLHLLKNPHASDEEISNIIPAPDFPLGGTIINGIEASKAIMCGRGSVVVRGKTHFETLKNGKESIIIEEIPYQVVKSRLIEKISELVRDKRVDGISNLRDESNKKGIRVVIELKRDASPQIVLNHLYRLTPLQSNFAVNSLVLNNNRPELMGVGKIIKVFLDFRILTIKRRLEFELRKIREKSHTLIGLRVAVDSIDEIISIIRKSPDHATAKATLIQKSWAVEDEMLKLFALVDDYRNKIENGRFNFTEEQVKAILDMRLARLTGLERDKITSDLQDAGKQMVEHLSTLGDRQKLVDIAAQELTKLKEEFAIPRRTAIENIQVSNSIEDFIDPEDVLIMITHNGYIKRTSLNNYGVQKRGGKGKIGLKIKDGDGISEVLVSHTHADMLLFSDRGIVYKIRTHTIPVGHTGQSQGRAIANLVTLAPKELINNILPVSFNEVTEEDCLIFATKQGNIRKSSMKDFQNVQSNGKIAIKLTDDKLIGVCHATNQDDILLATKEGMALRFSVESLRLIKSRSSDGVRGIKLDKKDEVISLSIITHAKENAGDREEYLSIPFKTRLKIKSAIENADTEEIESKVQQHLSTTKVDCTLPLQQIIKMVTEEEFILTATSKGFGKRTSAYEYRITGRGGKGIKNINLKNSDVIASFITDNDDDILLTSSKGKLIRCKATGVPVIGRSTKGVKIFNIATETVVSVTKIPATEDDHEQDAIGVKQSTLIEA